MTTYAYHFEMVHVSKGPKSQSRALFLTWHTFQSSMTEKVSHLRNKATESVELIEIECELFQNQMRMASYDNHLL